VNTSAFPPGSNDVRGKLAVESTERGSMVSTGPRPPPRVLGISATVSGGPPSSEVFISLGEVKNVRRKERLLGVLAAGERAGVELAGLPQVELPPASRAGAGVDQSAAVGS
jgi:hypothetical protein